MVNAPTGVVSHDGLLPNEDELARDHRKERSEVYDGEIDALVTRLLETNPDYRSLSKYEIIYKCYSVIENPSKLLKVAKQKAIIEEEKNTPVAAKATNSSSKVKPDVSSAPSPKNLMNEKKTEQVDLPVVKDNQVGHSNVSVSNETSTKDVDKATNNVLIKEEIKMAETKEAANLLAEAVGSIGAGSPVEKDAQSNVTTNSESKKAVERDVNEVMQNTVEQRKSFTQGNFVTKLIVESTPAIDRLVGEKEGRILTESKFNDSTKTPVEFISAKALDFAKGVSGITTLKSVDEFNKLDENRKWSNVAGSDKTRSDNISHAQQIWQLYTEALNDPNKTFAIAEPRKKNYTVKGYQVGDEVLGKDEMIYKIATQSVGFMYGPTGNTGNEKTTIQFFVSTSKRKETSQSGKASVAPQQAITKVGVIRPVNKDLMTQDESNLVFIYADGSTAKEKGMKALLGYKTDKDGNQVPIPATVPVYKLDQRGMKIQKPVNPKSTKNNGPSYQTRTLSLTAYVNVTEVVKEIPKFLKKNPNETDVITIQRFNLNIKNAYPIDVAGITDPSQMPITNIYVELSTGELSGEAANAIRSGDDIMKSLLAKTADRRNADLARMQEEL
jgi:hypothetical protein